MLIGLTGGGQAAGDAGGAKMSRIETIEVIPLRVGGSDVEDCDGTVDTVVVKLTDDEGRTGIGESDASPEAVKAFLETPTAHIWARRASEMLIGADPLEIAALWERLYQGTIYSGRTRPRHPRTLRDRHCAPRSRRKDLGVPAYKLMGGARRDTLRPYCTIYPGLPKDRSLQPAPGHHQASSSSRQSRSASGR